MKQFRKSWTTTALGRRHKAWLYACFVLLFASGALWLGFHYFGGTAGAPHPSEPWWMRIHGFAAMLTLVLFGSMMPQHIRLGWLASKRRMSGGAMVITLTLLALTGYGLYYLVDEVLRSWVSIFHWGIGFVLLPAGLVHVLYRREKALAGAHHRAQVRPPL